MIAAKALLALAARLAEVSGQPVVLGDAAPGEAPAGGAARLRMQVYSMAPVPDVSKMTGRHLADQTATLSWVFLLRLHGEAAALIDAVALVEAAAADIDGRPVLGGEGWRADMALEDAPEWARGHGAAIGLRMRAGLT